MRLLKSLLLASVAATLAGQAIAGGFSAEVVEPPVVVVEPEAPRSTFGLILPLALLGGLIALAVANEDDDDDGNETTEDGE